MIDISEGICKFVFLIFVFNYLLRFFISKTGITISNCSTKPLLIISALLFILNTAENVNFSSLVLREQALFDNTSGSIGTTLSTKYTEVARSKASSSKIVPGSNNEIHQQYVYLSS